jgi:flagellin
VNNKLTTHSLRLATGKRINSVADDAAGYTIARKLSVRSEGIGVAINNIGDAKNMLATAEGDLMKIESILQQMKSKVTQASNDTLGTNERSAISDELGSLTDQINAIVDQSLWNGEGLLSGKGISTTGFVFQFGANSVDEMTFNLNPTALQLGAGATGFDASGLGVTVTSTSSVATSYNPTNFTIANLSAVSTINTASTELSSGSYSIEITANTGTTATMKIRDAAGNLVSFDKDGDGTGSTNLGTSATISIAGGAVATFNTGLGLQFGLSGLATGEVGQFGVTYSQAHNVETHAKANAFMGSIDSAIDNTSKSLSYIGAITNRLTYQEETLSTAQINTEASLNRIENADMAREQLEQTKLTILQQTATAMLAQANAAPQAILSLFQ